jgi:hypothetical protein
MRQEPNMHHEEELEPFIPPQYMLYLAAAGLIVALITAFTQPGFSVIGWGGLGLAVISLVMWVLMAPERAKAFFTGRNLQISLTTIVVTVVFLVALMGIYHIVKQQEWRVDLTQRDEFSLTDAAREVVTTLGADPTKLPVRIYAFYGNAQAGRQDRDTLLFDDYVSSSAGKISYEFIDPDQNPVVTEQYGSPRAGQLVVAALGEDGAPDIENAETINFVSQEALTNAILQVSASGDFRAYFLTVQDGLNAEDTGASGFSELRDSLKLNKWTVEQITFAQLTSPDSGIDLADPVADGIVLVIPGGTGALPDEQLKVITDYLDNGGNLVLMGALNIDGPSLATADNFSSYLYDHFGFRMNNDIVMDLTAALQSEFVPLAADFAPNHFITANFGNGTFMAFPTTHSITINPDTPQDVTVTPLATSTADSFARTDLSTLTTGETTSQLDTDEQGPFTLAVAAENAATGARVVAFGSEYVGINNDKTLSAIGLQNLTAMLYSTAWAGNFDSFVSELPQVGYEALPQDTPIYAEPKEVRTINLVTIILLPFGVLLVGLVVWMNSREKEITR